MKVSERGLDDALSCFEGVPWGSCDAVPGLASALAAHAGRVLSVDWHLARMRDFDGSTGLLVCRVPADLIFTAGPGPTQNVLLPLAEPKWLFDRRASM